MGMDIEIREYIGEITYKTFSLELGYEALIRMAETGQTSYTTLTGEEGGGFTSRKSLSLLDIFGFAVFGERYNTGIKGFPLRMWLRDRRPTIFEELLGQGFGEDSPWANTGSSRILPNSTLRVSFEEFKAMIASYKFEAAEDFQNN